MATPARDLCDWTDHASAFVSQLAKSGYRVLLFDYRGTGDSAWANGAAYNDYDADVLGGVAELRRFGARKIVLVGGSLKASSCSRPPRACGLPQLAS